MISDGKKQFSSMSSSALVVNINFSIPCFCVWNSLDHNSPLLIRYYLSKSASSGELRLIAELRKLNPTNIEQAFNDELIIEKLNIHNLSSNEAIKLLATDCIQYREYNNTLYPAALFLNNNNCIFGHISLIDSEYRFIQDFNMLINDTIIAARIFAGPIIMIITQIQIIIISPGQKPNSFHRSNIQFQANTESPQLIFAQFLSNNILYFIIKLKRNCSADFVCMQYSFALGGEIIELGAEPNFYGIGNYFVNNASAIFVSEKKEENSNCMTDTINNNSAPNNILLGSNNSAQPQLLHFVDGKLENTLDLIAPAKSIQLISCSSFNGILVQLHDSSSTCSIYSAQWPTPQLLYSKQNIIGVAIANFISAGPPQFLLYNHEFASELSLSSSGKGKKWHGKSGLILTDLFLDNLFDLNSSRMCATQFPLNIPHHFLSGSSSYNLSTEIGLVSALNDRYNGGAQQLQQIKLFTDNKRALISYSFNLLENISSDHNNNCFCDSQLTQIFPNNCKLLNPTQLLSNHYKIIQYKQIKTSDQILANKMRCQYEAIQSCNNEKIEGNWLITVEISNNCSSTLYQCSLELISKRFLLPPVATSVLKQLNIGESAIVKASFELDSSVMDETLPQLPIKIVLKYCNINSENVDGDYNLNRIPIGLLIAPRYPSQRKLIYNYPVHGSDLLHTTHLCGSNLTEFDLLLTNSDEQFSSEFALLPHILQLKFGFQLENGLDFLYSKINSPPLYTTFFNSSNCNYANIRISLSRISSSCWNLHLSGFNRINLLNLFTNIIPLLPHRITIQFNYSNPNLTQLIKQTLNTFSEEIDAIQCLKSLSKQNIGSNELIVPYYNCLASLMDSECATDQLAGKLQKFVNI